MFTVEEPEVQDPAAKLNAELRNAQLDMLSAQCATDRLRLRFSIEEVVRRAHREVLHKALRSASALHDYYSLVCRQLTSGGTAPPPPAPPLSEEKTREGMELLAGYLRGQRELYFPAGVAPSRRQRDVMGPFFTPALLDRVRIAELNGRRLPNPQFYAQAQAEGFANLPEITHMAAVTFVDVIVFQDEMNARALFHGLVHAVQFEVLGVDGYCEAFVRSFVRERVHCNVPLEAQTIALEAKFAGWVAEGFSVEEEVQRWAKNGWYLGC